MKEEEEILKLDLEALKKSRDFQIKNEGMYESRLDREITIIETLIQIIEQLNQKEK